MQNLSRRRYGTHLLGSTLAYLVAPALFSLKAHAKGGGAPVLLAENYLSGTNPAPYLVSEKFDGVRALWDGKALVFRSGRAIAAPAWFTAMLPAAPLDGELWLARGQFDALSGIVRKAVPIDKEWQRVNYLVFEQPGGAGGFAERAKALRALVQQTAWPQLQAVEQFTLANAAQLQAKLAQVVQAGGEGLVLHLADAPYVTGRSPVLLKLKPQQDAEAVVLGHIAGKGKYAGMLGALLVQTEGGKRFKLGTGLSDAQRHSPPGIGSTVTYIYRDITPGGIPRFASFLRVQDGL